MTDNKADNAPARVWIKVIEEVNGSESYMLTYKADKDAIKYIPESVTGKREQALRDLVSDLTKWSNKYPRGRHYNTALQPIVDVYKGAMKNVTGQYSMADLVGKEWVMNYIIALENAIRETMKLNEGVSD